MYIGSAATLNENTFALTSCKNIFSKGKKKVPFWTKTYFIKNNQKSVVIYVHKNNRKNK